MPEIQFSKNFNDLCIRQGVNAGFQFEFYCERCSDTWRSEFVSYRSGQASGWVGKASGMLGGMLGSVGSALEGISEAGFGNARDEEFKKAIEQAKYHFHRCAKCHNFVCDTCWNSARGLCLDCAPDVDVVIEAAKCQGELEAASERAIDEGRSRAGKHDIKRDRQLVCPSCNAEAKGAKFCPECGQKLSAPSACPECNVEIPANAKFCPECGHKAST